MDNHADSGLKNDSSRAYLEMANEDISILSNTHHSLIPPIKNKKGSHILIVKINSGNSDAPEIDLTPIQIKKRFMETLKC